MTKTLEKEKEVSSVPLGAISQRQYLEKNFGKRSNEYQVDFKPVGKDRFRINFWSSKERPGAVSSFKDPYISRSYYVILTRKDISWSHTIL